MRRTYMLDASKTPRPRCAAGSACAVTKKGKPAEPRTEAEFLAGYDMSAFPRPSVAVDVAVVTVSEGRLQVVLYLRHEHPSKGRYALPGGFVRMDESLDEAAARL